VGLKGPGVFGGLGPGFEHLQLDRWLRNFSCGVETGVVVGADAAQGQQHTHN
jgi:hypothetical protein